MNLNFSHEEITTVFSSLIYAITKDPETRNKERRETAYRVVHKILHTLSISEAAKVETRR